MERRRSMSRLGRFLFRCLERIFGVYNEGPRTPPRYFEEVRMFRVLFPNADAEAWETAARSIVDRAYRDGWVRGHEWCERWWPDPPSEAERIAEARQQEWTLAERDAYWRDAMASVAPPRSPRELQEAQAEEMKLRQAWARMKIIPGPRERARRHYR